MTESNVPQMGKAKKNGIEFYKDTVKWTDGLDALPNNTLNLFVILITFN